MIHISVNTSMRIMRKMHRKAYFSHIGVKYVKKHFAGTILAAEKRILSPGERTTL